MMETLVEINNGSVKTSSKIVADVFGKAHRNVLRDIENLDCSDEFRALNFELSSYNSKQNKTLKCVEMTKDGFCFLAMGFTGNKAGRWKESYIKAFNEMEKGLNDFDKRASLIALEGESISEAGREWSRLGHEIKKSRKSHCEKVKSLLGDVQLKLELK